MDMICNYVTWILRDWYFIGDWIQFREIYEIFYGQIRSTFLYMNKFVPDTQSVSYIEWNKIICQIRVMGFYDKISAFENSICNWPHGVRRKLNLTDAMEKNWKATI